MHCPHTPYSLQLLYFGCARTPVLVTLNDIFYGAHLQLYQTNRKVIIEKEKISNSTKWYSTKIKHRSCDIERGLYQSIRIFKLKFSVTKQMVSHKIECRSIHFIEKEMQNPLLWQDPVTEAPSFRGLFNAGQVVVPLCIRFPPYLFIPEIFYPLYLLSNRSGTFWFLGLWKGRQG
jgi:hypothetical protein